MKLKNSVLGFLSVLLMLFLAGCNNAKKAETVKDEKVHLTLWSWDDTDAQKQQLALLPDNIDLELIIIPSAQYEQKLRVAINGGAAPDTFFVDGVYVPNYAYNGILLNIDEYVDKNYWDDYVLSSQKKCTYDNHIYALSRAETALVLYYNKDHFAEAGITNVPTKWDEAWTYGQLLDAAKKLTKRDAQGNITRFGVNPTMYTPDMISEGMTFTILNWLWNHDFQYVDPDYKTATGYLDSPKSIAALNSYGEFYKSRVAPLQAVEQGFQVGKYSIHIANISNVGAYEKQFPDLNFGIMPVPKDVHHYGTTGNWAYGISTQSKNPEAAYQILWAMAGPVGHKIYIEWSKAMPSLKSVMSLPMFTSDPRMMIGVETINNARPRNVGPGYAEISPILNELTNAVAYGEDPKNLVGPAVAKINRVINKYPAQ